MPLNKLDNFIKNTEGRILYVSPSDLDSTDSITNQGNSLARPFKTIQRALIESARFSYLKGNSNDITEKTTILLMPGEHVIDNRPGWEIYNDGGSAKTVAPDSNSILDANANLPLTLESNFDLTRSDNELYRFNSVNGGVIVPRGTSLVGLDLRKTKIRPKYVPNPTDDTVPNSAIFRITGACYFWQFSFFDGSELDQVYTSHTDFGNLRRSVPTFSHHKLTCFEYADGVNEYNNRGLTDLDMYYAKLSLAYKEGTNREIKESDRFPDNLAGFAKQRPEFEIVGAFAADPISITNIEAGSGGTATRVVTVTTATAHNLNAGTPIRIENVSDAYFNISTKVTEIDATNPNIFKYALSVDPSLVEAQPTVQGDETVTIETDTVSGASPYVFNISLRSVWGMNGMHADGANATGFRSMVVAQFTGVSLQKDDRSFVKYKQSNRDYSNTINYATVHGEDLSRQSSSPDKVLHLDSQAIYRNGWETVHIKITNDAILQIVSVFAIGYNKHFESQSGGDASITNSNSNFGQLSLISEGFKKEAFAKDNKAFITNIIGPRAINAEEEDVDWLSIDLDETNTSNKLYLFGFKDKNVKPPVLTQGFRVGAKTDDILYVKENDTTTRSAKIVMSDRSNSNTISSKKEFRLTGPVNNVFTTVNSSNVETPHTFLNGEKVIVVSDDGDLPENIKTNTVYYVINDDQDPTLTTGQIKLAASESEAIVNEEITVYGGTNLTLISRVSDKIAGEAGHPIQHDTNGWFIRTASSYTDANGGSVNSDIHLISGTEDSEPSFIRRKTDTRGLDDKIYKVRVVVPKELLNAKTPEAGFILQETSSTGVRGFDNTDFGLTTIDRDDYEYNKKPRFISTCSYSNDVVSVRTELPHNLTTGDRVFIRNVTDDVICTGIGTFNKGYNGDFDNITVTNDFEFTYALTDRTPGGFTNNTGIRTDTLPRFERNDLKSNLYIYRNEVIQEYQEGADGKDGIYYLYIANADNAVSTEFTSTKFSQNVVDLYPQLDRDNINDNPLSAASFAARAPLGDVSTNDLRKSITKESLDKLLTKFGVVNNVTNVSTNTITLENDHGLNGIVTGSIPTGKAGANYINGTYQNVKLLSGGSDPDSATWKGGTARVVVSGQAISSVEVISPGSDYADGDLLYFDQTASNPTSTLGSGDGAARFEVDSISAATGQTVQFTGSGKNEDTYYRISGVTGAKEFTIDRPGSDPETIGTDQYAYITGPSYTFTASYSSSTNLTTITTSNANDLNPGHRFLIRNSTTHAKVGEFFVTGKNNANAAVLTVKGDIGVTSGYILRPGIDANDETSDITEESINVRGTTLFGNETLTLASALTASSTIITIDLSSNTEVGIGTMKRFPLGSYIQIDEEIMRVASATLGGSGNPNDEITVIRGVLGTKKAEHIDGSLVKKIVPIPIEFRRPSILRASGHTFEYLGYGPGNYSTGLPQVQDRTISEREEFLSQAQERAAGVVVYTGMNNKGDFFIGNQRKSASTGEETTFDTPIPTVTGENASRLSAVFDEVTVKERIVVEGGDSNQILSQFDGPVTFSQKVRIKADVDFTELSTVKIKNVADSSDTTSGSLQVAGGVAIGKTTTIGGRLVVEGSNGTTSTSTTTGAVVVTGGVGISENLNVGGILNVGGTQNVTGIATFKNKVHLLDDDILHFGGAEGDDGDLQIRHNGNHSFIRDTGTGNLYIDSVDGSINLRTNDTESSIICTENAGTQIYWTGTSSGVRLETTEEGAKVTGKLRVTDDIIAFSSSDRNLKDNITPIDNSLNKVLTLSGNTFVWKDVNESDTGVIAQEVAALDLPGVTTTREDGTLAVRYDRLIPLLIEAIKDLNEKVDSLEQRLNN